MGFVKINWGKVVLFLWSKLKLNLLVYYVKASWSLVQRNPTDRGASFVCDLETSWMRRPWPTGGHHTKNQQTNKLRHGVLHLQSCYIFWLACSVFLEMVPFSSQLFNSHEPYPKLNVQNKPFPSNCPPFYFFFTLEKMEENFFFLYIKLARSLLAEFW